MKTLQTKRPNNSNDELRNLLIEENIRNNATKVAVKPDKITKAVTNLILVSIITVIGFPYVVSVIPLSGVASLVVSLLVTLGLAQTIVIGASVAFKIFLIALIGSTFTGAHVFVKAHNKLSKLFLNLNKKKNTSKKEREHNRTVKDLNKIYEIKELKYALQKNPSFKGELPPIVINDNFYSFDTFDKTINESAEAIKHTIDYDGDVFEEREDNTQVVVNGITISKYELDKILEKYLDKFEVQQETPYHTGSKRFVHHRKR